MENNLKIMENKLNLFQRLSAVMNDLDYIQRGDKKVNNMYRFVSHDQVTAKIHPLMVKYGIVLIPSILELTQDENRTVVKLEVTFVNIDDPIDRISNIFFGYGIDTGDKGPGKAVSYAFKYAILKTFCLETGDDPDQDQYVVYEALNDLEEEFVLPSSFSAKKKKEIMSFLEYSAKESGKNIEILKKEAGRRMEDFLIAFDKWTKKEIELKKVG